MGVHFVGVLNVTPDSFSDGGRYIEAGIAVERALRMQAEGAAFVDIGADSTRPGSECVGPDEEWRRLAPVLAALDGRVPFSVDTHHALTARRALDLGAICINDIWAGRDPGMFEAVANSTARIVLMHSRLISAHVFGADIQTDIFARARDFCCARAKAAMQSGIPVRKIILDPGMGAFVSSDPQVSMQLVQRFSDFQCLGHDLMLAVSRKGFLRRPGECRIEERDELSANICWQVARRLLGSTELFVRVHDVALHRRAAGVCSEPQARLAE